MLVCGAQAAPPICARGPMGADPGTVYRQRHGRSGHRRSGALTHRARLQGKPSRHAPGRPGSDRRAGRARPGPATGPGGHRRPPAGLRAAGRRIGVQPGARGGCPARIRPPARRHDHPVLLVVIADHQNGDARDPGRRGRRVHLRRGRDGEPRRQGQQRHPSRHGEPGLRRREGPHRDGGGRGRARLARPPGGRRCCRTCTSRWARPPRTWLRCAVSPVPSRTSSPSARRTSPSKRSRTASTPGRSPR